MENELVIAVKGMIVRVGRVLIIKRSEDDEHDAGIWECPGGKVEFGEDLEVALLREIKEEVNLAVTVDSLLYAATFKSNEHRQVVILSYLCYAIDYNITLSDEHYAYLWADKDQMMNHLPESILADIARYSVWERLLSSGVSAESRRRGMAERAKTS